MTRSPTSGRQPPPSSSHLERLLRAGDLRAARALVMALYREPLIAYVRRVSWARGLASEPGCETPESLVDGFFGERLAEDHVLLAWTIERSRFRHWICTTFRNYLLALAGKQRQDRANHTRYLSRLAEQADRAAEPSQVMDEALRVTLVRAALQIAGERAFRRGRADEWQAFLLHELEGRPFSALADLLPVGAGRASASMRRMRQFLLEAIRELVAWPGADDRAIDEELQAVLGRPSRKPAPGDRGGDR